MQPRGGTQKRPTPSTEPPQGSKIRGKNKKKGKKFSHQGLQQARRRKQGDYLEVCIRDRYKRDPIPH